MSACVFDVNGYGVIDTFQQYVRPTWYPKLSEKFVDRFDISENDLWDQPDLEQTLQLFYEWMDYEADYPMLFNPGYICTWFSHDLGTVLPREANRKGIEYRESMQHWIDVSKVVRVSIQWMLLTIILIFIDLHLCVTGL